MEGMLKDEQPGWQRRRRALLLTAAAMLSLSLAFAAGPAAAKKLSGTKKSEKLVGTKKADRLNGKGGNDKLVGRKGKDILKGGKGADRLVGGKGADKHLGGPGDDRIFASDGRLDRAINGGAGTNACVIDVPLELSIAKNCATIVAGSGGRGGNPGSPGGGGSETQLRVLSANGLVCLPLLGCPFLVSGDGADALVGNVSGGGAVTSVLNVAVNVVTGDWVATGTYSCSLTGGAGYLVVTIGAKSTPQIPVSCS